jgi:Flp pilus assembly pilin Flp
MSCWNTTRRDVRTRTLRLAGDESAQDLIEYALLAAAVAVIVAAFIPTEILPVLTTLYSKITVSLNAS